MSDMHNYKNLLKMNGRVLPTVAIQLLKSKKQKDKKRYFFFSSQRVSKKGLVSKSILVYHQERS